MRQARFPLARLFATLTDKFGRLLKPSFFTGRESFYECYNLLDDALRVAKEQLYGSPHVPTIDCREELPSQAATVWKGYLDFEKYLGFKLRKDEYSRLVGKLDELDVFKDRAPLIKELTDGFVMQEVFREQQRLNSYREKVDKNGISHATGCRKRSKCDVWCRRDGTGRVIVDELPIHQYFLDIRHLAFACRAFEVTNSFRMFDVFVKFSKHSGPSAEAQAVCHGIANALVCQSIKFLDALEEASLLKLDPRISERKKFGQYKARSKFQWTKR